MIIGIGTDLVKVSRMHASLQRWGQRFAERILSVEELQEFKPGDAAFLAKRFASKEAAAKALGTGIRDGIRLKDIFISHSDLGQPQLVFQGVALETVKNKGINHSHISISDEKDYALAFVVLSA